MPQQQLTAVIFMLLEGLVDSQSNCSRAASVILNTLLKNRGAGLQDMVAQAHAHTHTNGVAACTRAGTHIRIATYTHAGAHTHVRIDMHLHTHTHKLRPRSFSV